MFKKLSRLTFFLLSATVLQWYIQLYTFWIGSESSLDPKNSEFWVGSYNLVYWTESFSDPILLLRVFQWSRIFIRLFNFSKPAIISSIFSSSIIGSDCEIRSKKFENYKKYKIYKKNKI